MPLAMLARSGMNSEGRIISEYLHREETIFVEPHWNWRAGQSAAFIFPSTESAEVVRGEHPWPDEPGTYLTWLLIVAGPDREQQRRREEGRVATALSRAAETPEAGCQVPQMEVAARAARPVRTKKGIPMRASGRDGQNGQNGPLPDGAKRWEEIYRERVAPRHVSPEECFERLERENLA